MARWGGLVLLLTCTRAQPELTDDLSEHRRGDNPPPWPEVSPPPPLCPEPVDPAPGDAWTTPAGTFVWVPSGRFWMGSSAGAPDRYPDEGPRHEVSVRGLWVARTEVSQGLWTSFGDPNPSLFAECGDQCPVENVSWHDAVGFANRLSEREGLPPAYRIDGDEVTWDRTSPGYRLLTEAEWEYAARGGGDHRYSGTDDDVETGWIFVLWGSRVPCHKLVNGFGLCDFTGNVSEWVWDRYQRRYPAGPRHDPAGPDEGELRVVRGGTWYATLRKARLARRWAIPPSEVADVLGIRLARNATRASSPPRPRAP